MNRELHNRNICDKCNQKMTFLSSGLSGDLYRDYCRGMVCIDPAYYCPRCKRKGYWLTPDDFQLWIQESHRLNNKSTLWHIYQKTYGFLWNTFRHNGTLDRLIYKFTKKQPE
jgi:hypothetical protein